MKSFTSINHRLADHNAVLDKREKGLEYVRSGLINGGEAWFNKVT